MAKNGKTAFVLADVHGYHNLMMKTLAEHGFDANNPGHILVSLGDLIDRGEDSLVCLRFVNSLPKERKVLILGNHELLLESALSRGHFHDVDFSNGTADTISQLAGVAKTRYLKNYLYQGPIIEMAAENEEWQRYIKSCQWYWENSKYIFVHGWIPCLGADDAYYPMPEWRRNGNGRDWFKATWANGMAAWRDGVTEKDKVICCGHWNTSWGHSHLHKHGTEFGAEACFEPFIDNGIIALDACTAYSGKMNCLVIKNFEEKTGDEYA